MEALLIDYLLNRSSELKTQPMVYYISRAELVLCVELANNGDKDGKLLINELLKENPHPSRVGLFTFRFFEGISTSFVFSASIGAVVGAVLQAAQG